MSEPLSIADHLLARARLMLQLGRSGDARRLLRRALVHPDLPNRLRSDALRLMGSIELAASRFHRARRLLAAAIRLRRHADDLYVEYARVVSADPDGDPRLAVKALRRAVGIDPFEPGSWAALGTAAIRVGDRKLARKAFRRAARLRPDSMSILNELVDGFVELGYEDDARSVLTAARFRAPNDAAVAAAWERFQFNQALRRQDQGQPDKASILPFSAPQRASCGRPGDAVVLRADRSSTTSPHLLRMFGRRFDPRRAQ